MSPYDDAHFKKCENNRCLICGNNTPLVQWASWNIVHLNTDGSSP